MVTIILAGCGSSATNDRVSSAERTTSPGATAKEALTHTSVRSSSTGLDSAHPCSVLTAAMAASIAGLGEMTVTDSPLAGGIAGCEYRPRQASHLIAVLISLVPPAPGSSASLNSELELLRQEEERAATTDPSHTSVHAVAALGVPAFAYTTTAVDVTTYLDFVAAGFLVNLDTIGLSATSPPYAALEATVRNILAQ
jgi:hypothetical protein